MPWSSWRRPRCPAAHPDLKLVVDFGAGAPADGSYVRVAAREPWAAGAPARRIRAVFTSLAEVDRARIERLLGPGVVGRARLRSGGRPGGLRRGPASTPRMQ